MGRRSSRRRKAVSRGEARIGAGKRGRGAEKAEQHYGQWAGDWRNSVGNGQALVPKVSSRLVSGSGGEGGFSGDVECSAGLCGGVDQRNALEVSTGVER
jgi:hypothetical protein